ncbi:MULTISPECIES: hypothetical protein [Crateriforma]|uniref:Uncharacterized protein n=1 Tax=Crateriforma conspicua TaxID=2527996 RepID=A0A5C6FVF5_9PLAN|nr:MULTISPECIES: hypothetical protein [Crateriforma]TWU65348.1 hypothetical protein V7x_08950 [Crateriforma conspicua]
MTAIRTFCNADLPGLLEVWIRHWSAVGPPPSVSVPMIEQSILARTFFDATQLLVAVDEENRPHAWAHFLSADEAFTSELGPYHVEDPAAPHDAVLAAICFDGDGGLAMCDDLLREVQSAASRKGFTRLLTGPLRDKTCGYAGLSPIGHGIGVPSHDARTSSLLSRQGFTPTITAKALTAATSTYRPPVGRESLMLRRSTRTDSFAIYPRTARQASAMSHLDLEQHQLIDHRSGTVLAEVVLWISDPESQVMNVDKAILDLSSSFRTGGMDSTDADLSHESYLIASIVSGLPNRRIFEVETSVDQDDTKRIEQLTNLKFTIAQQGQRWEKPLNPSSEQA